MTIFKFSDFTIVFTLFIVFMLCIFTVYCCSKSICICVWCFQFAYDICKYYNQDIGYLSHQETDDLDFWLSREDTSAPALPAEKDDEPVESDIHMMHNVETEKVRQNEKLSCSQFLHCKACLIYCQFLLLLS